MVSTALWNITILCSGFEGWGNFNFILPFEKSSLGESYVYSLCNTYYDIESQNFIKHLRLLIHYLLGYGQTSEVGPREPQEIQQVQAQHAACE